MWTPINLWLLPMTLTGIAVLRSGDCNVAPPEILAVMEFQTLRKNVTMDWLMGPLAIVATAHVIM